MSRGVLIGKAQWTHDEGRMSYRATLHGIDYVLRPAPALFGWDLTRTLPDGREVSTEHRSPSEAMSVAMLEADRV